MPKPEYRRGDVVWVPFTYSDFTGGKARPALIVSTPDFSACTGDYIMVAITGQVAAHTGHPTCYELQDWQGAGLAVPSIIASHCLTLSTARIGARAGKLATGDMKQVDKRLRRALGL